jgi:SpoIVB peptidase S55
MARLAQRFAYFLLFLSMMAGVPLAAAPPESNEILPLLQVHAGMQGYAYTVFAGDQVEKFDLVVVGIMPNFLGPKQSIILVELKGPKVEHTGVVAGMSGSPVYLDGKLAGALSLKLGIFTKEALAGVTPIEDILHPPEQSAGMAAGAGQFALPSTTAAQGGLPNGAALQPIETPLVFSGFQPSALQPFATQLQSYGFVAAQGGTAEARPDDGKLAAGDMAGMVLVQGDASINSACTVTAVRGDNVYLATCKCRWPGAAW